MSEVFKEYLIKQKKSTKDTLLQIAVIGGAAILSVAALVLVGPGLGPIIIAAIIFGAVYLNSRLNKEYEYILTNNELDIDVIYNRNTRKRILTVDMRKIEVMAGITDKSHADAINKPGLKLINASDNMDEKGIYAIIADLEKSGLSKILISPNPVLLGELYKQAPSKVFK